MKFGSELFLEKVRSVKETNDNGFIITGTYDSDVTLIKTNSEGFPLAQ